MKRLLATLLLALAACRSHVPYRVTDLETGSVYHTRELRRGRTSGFLYLKDPGTGAQVTIRDSIVDEISEEDYLLATGTK